MLYAAQAHHRQAIAGALHRYRARTLGTTGDEQRVYVRTVSYVAVAQNATQWANALGEQYGRRARLLSVPQMMADPEVANVQAAIEGFAIIRQIRADIAALPKTPTDFQLSIIWFVVELLAPRIFGKAWTTDRVRIKKIMGWAGDRYGIGAVLTGRKEGKSTGLSMACSIVLMNLKSIPVALFSRTKEQSCIILGMAKEILAAHPRMSSFKMTTSATKIVLEASKTDVRVMTAYSGEADVSITVWVRGGGKRHISDCHSCR